MLTEVLEALKIKESGIYIDGTAGLGGHAEGILKNAQQCTLIAMDSDELAIQAARERLKPLMSERRKVHFVRDNFSNMKTAVNELGYEKVDGILLDLGVSTLQLKSEGGGFSFLKDEPPDMRMDKRQRLTAAEIVNRYPEKDLAHIIWQYGDEGFSRKIAREIVAARKKKPVSSCMELAEIIERAIGRRGRIHPATKTFQALRIEVNRELAVLTAAIDEGAGLLNKGGRFCVLSYHSLEDRIVKNSFKKLSAEGRLSIITKKPLVPGREEIRTNPSSRSAKFRAAEAL